ncbi:MAG TPA: UDP-N-acetylglucosamine 1-carboxyvinyltransferase [Firmicutes bacterium]|nr:UDP-N-acetylglucosamine 1-carboxyvinyltransferase [Bacillota bacterium]
MAKLLIRGGNPLKGTVEISGSKNSALPIIVAACLAEGESVLENIPRDIDVYTICKILQELGAEIWFDEQNRLHVNPERLESHQASYDLVRRMRASFYVAGLLLARLGKAEVPLPGGCALGSRPVDFHLKGFQALGAKVSIEHGYVKAEADELTGTKIYINRSSVGTTINLMLAASKAKGTTVLENAAKEPEVVDLAIYLSSMGARIRGAGTDVIRIDGVEKLRGTEYVIISDRIEAGTFMVACGITGGELVLTNVVPEHLRSTIMKCEEAGMEIEEDINSIRVRAQGRPAAVDVETAPYPGFPTDLQQPFAAMMSIADGTSIIRETIFDRFRYVDELRRMGADIKVERDTAIIRGVPELTGAQVEATDLRAGAALVLAGLAAKGETEISGVELIDRGYEHLDVKLKKLGADIERIEEEPNPWDEFLKRPMLERL